MVWPLRHFETLTICGFACKTVSLLMGDAAIGPESPTTCALSTMDSGSCRCRLESRGAVKMLLDSDFILKFEGSSG